MLYEGLLGGLSVLVISEVSVYWETGISSGLLLPTFYYTSKTYLALSANVYLLRRHVELRIIDIHMTLKQNVHGNIAVQM